MKHKPWSWAARFALSITLLIAAVGGAFWGMAYGLYETPGWLWPLAQFWPGMPGAFINRALDGETMQLHQHLWSTPARDIQWYALGFGALTIVCKRISRLAFKKAGLHKEQISW